MNNAAQFIGKKLEQSMRLRKNGEEVFLNHVRGNLKEDLEVLIDDEIK